MKLKGLVWIFTIALIAISLYQLSFTMVTRNFENKIRAKASARLKTEKPNLKEGTDAFNFAVTDMTRYMLDSQQTEEIYPLLGTTYQKCKEQELNLGLDLQGGMNVVLEVGIDDLVSKLSNNPKDPSLIAAIASANEKKANSGADFITLFSEAYNEQNPNGQLAPLFVKNSTEGLSFSSSNADVIGMLNREAGDAFDRTANVITKRIDQFGVSQPTINAEKDKGIITVELAGVQNPQKVRWQLESTASLEFWETYAIHEIGQDIIDADKALKDFYDNRGSSPELKTGDSTVAKVDNPKPKKSNDTSGNAVSDLLGGGDSGDDGDSSAFADLSDEEQRAKALKENPLRFFLLGGFQPQQDPETGKMVNECRVSYVKNSDTAALNKLLAMDVVKREFPRDLKFLYGKSK